MTGAWVNRVRYAGGRRRLLAGVVATAATGVLGGCGAGSRSRDGQPGVSVVAQRLRVPWGVSFLPDGGALVTERDTRRILEIGPDSGPEGLRVSVVQAIEEADARGEGGLLGIVVSPLYESDRTVFVYYTTSHDNRIARLVLGGRPQPIVTGIPISGIHNGGRLAFGPDGYLYATTGDASQRGLAQDLSSLGGKMLRMTTDGQPAPGNPFHSLVWSYGHRNVQGLDWDARGGLYAAEFGSSEWDEINRIEPGRNYGWPHVEGMGRDDRYVNPILVKRPTQASWSGLAVIGSTIVAACLRGQRIWLADLTDSGAAHRARAHLAGEYGRLRTPIHAPDGSLWLTTSNHDGRGAPGRRDDRILRLEPTSLAVDR